MVRFVLSFLGALFSWVVTAFAFLALVVGGVLWVYSRDLPSHEQLAQYSPKTISRIYDNDGRLMDEFAEERRIFQPIEEIPDLVKQAFISAEDKNFYVHHGYDPRGMIGALMQAAQGRTMRGASTITQQVMKNFLLSSDRTIERKVKELILATRLEQTLTKGQILELYLNEIFLGQNSFGVAAAAQTYFNKTLSQLAPHEAAMLAAMPQAPSRSVVRDKGRITERRNYVLREMMQNGYLTRAVYEGEIQQPLRTVQNGDFPSFRRSLPPRDYFTDEIRRQLSAQFGRDEFFGGGLQIRATVDPEMQQLAGKALREALEKYDRGLGVWRGTGKEIEAEDRGSEEAWRAALADLRVPRDIPGWHPAVVLGFNDAGDARIGIEGVDAVEGGHWVPSKDAQWARKRNRDGSLAKRAVRTSDLVDEGDVVLVREMTDDGSGAFIRWTLRQVPQIEGGFMAMDVNTGRVRAMQGGFSYQSSVFNRATQAQRQPGSSFKPFVYAAALDSGYTPATIVEDSPIVVNTPQGLWQPKNAGGTFLGAAPLRLGVELSRNLMTIRVAQDISMQLVAQYAEKFGVYDHLSPYLANALGAQETTLYKMVAAYAMFANGGERVEPTLVDRVQDRRGQTIYRHDERVCETCAQAALPAGREPVITADRERVMDAITAYQLTSMMQGVVQRGSGSGVDLPVPVAGKTGTTNDAKDVWFIGYTSNMVAGCYLGYDQPRTLGAHAYGGTLCVPVFNAFMKEAVKKYGGTTFKVPPGGHFVKVDRRSGAILSADTSGPGVISEYFRDGSERTGPVRVVTGGFIADPDAIIIGDLPDRADPLAARGHQVTTSSGQRKAIPKQADFGTLSTGGLY